MPAAIQTEMNNQKVGRWTAMSPGVRRMPAAIVFPMITARPKVRPRIFSSLLLCGPNVHKCKGLRTEDSGLSENWVGGTESSVLSPASVLSQLPHRHRAIDRREMNHCRT